VASRKERAAETEAALKAAAREQFVQRGYLATKITDITAAAGRATGSFYEHFASKDDLLEALLADLGDQAGEEVTERHPVDHDLRDLPQLHDHLAATWTAMRDNLPVMIALFESSVSSGPARGQAWARLTEQTVVLREHLEWLVQQGHRGPGDPTLTGAAIGGMLSMLAYALLSADVATYTDDQVVDTLTRLLAYGIVGPATSEEDAGSG
jgi:AcrR family transcriptional regulator